MEKKVYVVFANSFDDFLINPVRGIFSKRELAEQYVDKVNPKWDCQIYEYELNKCEPED